MTAPLIPPRCVDELRLVATRPAITCAGLFVVSTLTQWGGRSVLLDSVKVTEELVTNAVQATGIMQERVHWTELTRMEFITVRLLGCDESIRIEVWDGAPHPPPLPEPDSETECTTHEDCAEHDDVREGRTVRKRQRTMKRGWYPTARGKVVWAEFTAVFPAS